MVGRRLLYRSITHEVYMRRMTVSRFEESLGHGFPHCLGPRARPSLGDYGLFLCQIPGGTLGRWVDLGWGNARWVGESRRSCCVSGLRWPLLDPVTLVANPRQAQLRHCGGGRGVDGVLGAFQPRFSASAPLPIEVTGSMSAVGVGRVPLGGLCEASAG